MLFKRITFLSLMCVCASAALWQLSSAAIIAGKAFLAPVLIETAWSESLVSGKKTKPWSWADTYPVAKITAKRLHESEYIMAGDNMRSLAFGPVMAEGADVSAIYGHRDTHFSFLQHIQVGDELGMEYRSGENANFKVQGIWVAHKDELYMPLESSSSDIFLITCYPFNALNPNSDQRYIVWASNV